MLGNALVMVTIIFVINVVYVSFFTIRMILTLKGRRYIAASVGMVEVVIYVIGLGLVLDNLNEIHNLIAYALGFGTGVIVGTKIEDKLALGYITVNVISSNPDIEFTRRLREKGYGVTSWFAYGMEGDRLAMQILTPRKYELRLYETIKEIDPKAFIIAYEPKQIYGGFWVKQVRRGRLMNSKKAKQKEQAQTEQQTDSLAQQSHTPENNGTDIKSKETD